MGSRLSKVSHRRRICSPKPHKTLSGDPRTLGSQKSALIVALRQPLHQALNLREDECLWWFLRPFLWKCRHEIVRRFPEPPHDKMVSPAFE
jgi:hypothetical protein